MIRTFVLMICAFSLMACQSINNGIDRFQSIVPKLKGKRIGIVVNQTSVDKNDNHLISLIESNGLNLRAVFSPEHGLKGDLADGQKYESADSIFYSLYGKTKRPTIEMMNKVDIIIYDMQDVGTRFYTYINTMGYVMKASAENNKKFIVLDRLNYMGHETVAGLILDEKLKSGIGQYPIPAVYGLTVGELALAIKRNKWIEGLDKLEIDVIKIENWDGKKVLKNSKFIPTSPNIPDIETIFLYGGLCLLEGTNLSEGRGSDHAFKWVGAPWLKNDKIVSDFKYKGVRLSSIEYTPKTIKGKAWKPKFEDKVCKGLEFKITDYDSFNSFEFTLKLLSYIAKTHEEFKIDRQQYFDWLLGSDKITNKNISDESIIKAYLLNAYISSKEFKNQQSKYYIY